MSEGQQHYSIDTSVFINAWTRDYPPEVVPALWDSFIDLIAGGRMHASKEVLLEIERKADDVYLWCRSQKELWVPLDALTVVEAQNILAAFPDFVKTGTGRNQADPFVIALAKVYGYTVVTWEKGGSQFKPRIPYVCGQVGVPCINLIGLAKAEKWVFTRNH
jgi:Domain of unknown function (DUF4411)